jgi:hypothetical protein
VLGTYDFEMAPGQPLLLSLSVEINHRITV